MNKIFFNIIIIPMLGYFHYRTTFHYFKLFFLTLFMTIYGYFQLFHPRLPSSILN